MLSPILPVQQEHTSSRFSSARVVSHQAYLLKSYVQRHSVNTALQLSSCCLPVSLRNRSQYSPIRVNFLFVYVCFYRLKSTFLKSHELSNSKALSGQLPFSFIMTGICTLHWHIGPCWHLPMRQKGSVIHAPEHTDTTTACVRQCARSHTKVHAQGKIAVHIHTDNIYIRVCVWEHERQGLLVPEAAMLGSVGADSERAQSVPWATEHWSLCQLREMESPFSLSAIMCMRVCVCVCAHAHDKSNEETEVLALLWTLSLCYKSLLYAVCIVSPFEPSPSLLLTAVYPLSMSLVSSL